MNSQHVLRQTLRRNSLRCLFAWALSFVLLASISSAHAADSWQAVGTAGFSAGPAYGTSLALDSTGRPYVAYTDGSNGDKTMVMRLNAAGTGWEVVGGAGFSGNSGWTSLVFDSTGRPYVVYCDDWFNGGKATVMRLKSDSLGWEVVGTARFSAGQIYAASLVLDSTDRPYVAYTDGGNGHKVMVMRLDVAGIGWEVVGDGGLSGEWAWSTSLAMDSSDSPYVAYIDSLSNSNKAVVKRLNAAGTNWETVGGAEISTDRATYTSLALDATGRPYVAYGDVDNSGKATVMRLNAAGTGWEAVGGAGFSVSDALHTFLVLDAAGRPYVAYTDGGNSGKATVMRLNAAGTGWEAVGDAGFSIDEMVGYTSLALDAHGRPFLAYGDVNGYGIKATVMQWRTAPSTPAAPTDNGGSAVLSYAATASPSSASCEATAPATSCVITGLTMGQTYTFSVTATNAQGTSPASAPSAAVTLGAPTRTAQAIPMLNAWALAGLALALAALSALALRRRAS